MPLVYTSYIAEDVESPVKTRQVCQSQGYLWCNLKGRPISILTATSCKSWDQNEKRDWASVFFPGLDFLLDAKCSTVPKRSPEAPMRLCSVMTRFTWTDIPGQFVSFQSQMNPLNSLPVWNYKKQRHQYRFSMNCHKFCSCWNHSWLTHLSSTPRLQDVNEWTGTPSTTSPPPTAVLPRYRTGTVDRITSVQPGKTAASLTQLANCILQQQKRKKKKREK